MDLVTEIGVYSTKFSTNIHSMPCINFSFFHTVRKVTVWKNEIFSATFFPSNQLRFKSVSENVHFTEFLWQNGSKLMVGILTKEWQDSMFPSGNCQHCSVFYFSLFLFSKLIRKYSGAVVGSDGFSVLPFQHFNLIKEKSIVWFKLSWIALPRKKDHNFEVFFVHNEQNPTP